MFLCCFRQFKNFNALMHSRVSEQMISIRLSFIIHTHPSDWKKQTLTQARIPLK